ncbi:hypothetical protein COY23_00480 [bacterium (Candidatus Torokbacteria) CG_4_10_14_0_2_um_filter_35_8]|nr:MAG: hypothetical protein COY23_00480 [bacterium (Candidatus Torokbacteria) CG_4_10_14_0_2_um_filter_35_8]
MRLFKLKSKSILSLFVATLLFLSLSFVLPERTFAYTGTIRYAGDNRYDTAAKICQSVWDKPFIDDQGNPGYHDSEGNPVDGIVVLASGQNYPDALAGVAIGAPVLLTTKGSLSSETLTELYRLRAKYVVILGKDGAVSINVENQVEGIIDNYYDDSIVYRIGGDDRYQTAYEIADTFFPVANTTDVFIATGSNFPDSLSVAPVAAEKRAPLLLVKKDSVPQSTINYLEAASNLQNVYVIGGEGVISASVFNDLDSYGVNGATRISGADRFATSIAIAEYFYPTLFESDHPFPSGSDDLVFATGSDFPDALSGSYIVFLLQTPILLVLKDSVPSETLMYVDTNFTLDTINTLIYLGGIGVISTDVENIIYNALEQGAA